MVNIAGNVSSSKDFLVILMPAPVKTGRRQNVFDVSVCLSIHLFNYQSIKHDIVKMN